MRIHQTFPSITYIKASEIGYLQLSRVGCGLRGMAHIYGDDQSDRVPQREFQRIGPIIDQNVMIFFINYSTHLVLTIHYYFDYLPRLNSMKVSVLLISFSKMNFYQAYPCQ